MSAATDEKKLRASFTAFDKQAKDIIERIAKERDRLRALLSEYEDILQSADNANDDFEEALDRLSQFL